MFYQDVVASLIAVGDQTFEVIASDEMEQGYTVHGKNGLSFIMSVNEDGEWVSDTNVSAVLVRKIGAVIDQNDL